MAHFARIENNDVTEVIVISQDWLDAVESIRTRFPYPEAP